MRERVLAWEDLTDSRAMLEARPSRFGTTLLVMVAGMLLLALLWMVWGDIDMVVRTTGLVRPVQQGSVVRSATGGYVTAVHVREGMDVKQGDLLYTLDTTAIDPAYSHRRQEQTDVEARLAVLSDLQHSIGTETPMGQTSSAAHQWHVYASEQEELTMEYTQLQEEYERELALDSLPPQSLAALQWEVERSKLRREAHHQRTLQGLAEQIRTEEQMLRTLQSEIRELEKRIAESTVLAPISGTVSFLASFNVGEYLPPGFETLQIIPDHSSGYQVEIVIENTKISQVQPGQTVHYRIPSLPSRDYGPLQGRITYLTPDATITTARGALAYQALADVEDHHGVPIQLGMLAEARIQVGRTSILFYVLDKLDLMRRGPIPRG